MVKKRTIKKWEKLRDEDILQMRIRDFGVQIKGSILEPFIERLYKELDSKEIKFHPQCYLADEWLCPDKVPIIGIPFYLAHPRLKQIEQKLMFEVEGGTEASCMKLLRHECGHAINYAYQLYKRTRWRKLFGPFSQRYSDSYNYQPYSRRFVVHLQDNYAQSHPDEDFAETFGVWLAPGSNWQGKYKGWPVIKKLHYVDGLMKRICNQSPIISGRGQTPWSASRMISTLGAFYERRRRSLGTEFQGFYDDNIKRIFTTKDTDPAYIKASQFLRQYRRELVDNVADWTGHRKYDMHQLVKRIILRCDALNLYTQANGTDNIIGLTALITAIASNTLTVSKQHKHK